MLYLSVSHDDSEAMLSERLLSEGFSAVFIIVFVSNRTNSLIARTKIRSSDVDKRKKGHMISN